MLPEGLLVEVLNLIPRDYSLSVKSFITGKILIEKDHCHINIINALPHMNYWVNYSQDLNNKEFAINILSSDLRKNTNAYKSWLETNKNNFKDQRSILLYLTKYILFANIPETPKTSQILNFINFSNICYIKFEYSYQFASVLKNSFNRGEICWVYPLNLIAWVDIDGNAYINSGLIHNEKHELLFVPESYLTVIDLEGFKHVDIASGDFTEYDPKVFCTDVVYEYCRDIINKAGIKLNLNSKKEN